MPITSIIQQPGSSSVPKIYAAYRPIIFVARAQASNGTRLPPRVFCDIYFNNVFYKTLSATQYKKLNDISSDWQFDISAACQEFLSFNLPSNGGSAIEVANNTIVAVYCKFRSSGYDVNGFLIPEGSAPAQATGTKPAGSGQGFLSESFQVINAVLQHEDVQDLQTHLQYARPNGSFETNTFPLTHRPNGYKVCKGDSDFYPFVHLGNKSFSKISLVKTDKTGTPTTVNFTVPQTCSSVVSGVTATVSPDNDVAVTFGSSGPAPQWEWTINGGTTWVAINSTSFNISWEDLLRILITESGADIISENGEIIIPEDVNPFTTYTLQVRPRCSNGAYGTSGTTTYDIDPTPVCPLPTLSFSSKSEDNQTITFNTTIPSPYSQVQLEWKFDYGNGTISASNYEDLSPTNPFIWSAPTRADQGTYKVRIRTKCDTDYFSPFTSWVDVPWDKAPNTVNVFVSNGIYNAPAQSYAITVNSAEILPQDILVSGFFLGDGLSGGRQTFNFSCVIPAGALSAVTMVGGAEPGGIANNFHITNISPNPVSSGKKLIYS
jgi:hypothetical protein